MNDITRPGHVFHWLTTQRAQTHMYYTSMLLSYTISSDRRAHKVSVCPVKTYCRILLARKFKMCDIRSHLPVFVTLLPQLNVDASKTSSSSKRDTQVTGNARAQKKKV